MKRIHSTMWVFHQNKNQSLQLDPHTNLLVLLSTANKLCTNKQKAIKFLPGSISNHLQILFITFSKNQIYWNVPVKEKKKQLGVGSSTQLKFKYQRRKGERLSFRIHQRAGNVNKGVLFSWAFLTQNPPKNAGLLKEREPALQLQLNMGSVGFSKIFENQ